MSPQHINIQHAAVNGIQVFVIHIYKYSQIQPTGKSGNYFLNCKKPYGIGLLNGLVAMKNIPVIAFYQVYLSKQVITIVSLWPAHGC